MKIHKLKVSDAAFPEALKQIPDPPFSLKNAGDLKAFEAPCVAIVGTRGASPYGLNIARQFARELAGQGICIVSGLAYGIDAAAHEGALEANGRTIAVLAQALPEISPGRHRDLARRIIEGSGLLISEREEAGPNYPSDFLIRNRLISGLSKGVLVVEAPLKSGALNTAKHAADQGRDVMVIPGRLDDLRSQGCHRLLQNGAQLVSTVSEMMDFMNLPWSKSNSQWSPGLAADDLDTAIYNALKNSPSSGATIADRLNQFSVGEVYQRLSQLELKGRLQLRQDLSYCLSPRAP